MTLSSARRTPLFEQVAAQLREQITAGRWPVGSRIPTEPELAEQLGVARGTLREAVRALAHNGLLDIRQGSGTYVVSSSELAGVMRRRFADFDREHVKELRTMLETSAAGLAALRRTEADLVHLDALLDRRERAWRHAELTGELEDFVQADAALHHAIVEAAHNPALSGIYADLGDFFRAELRDFFAGELTPDRHVDHTRLIAAIRAGDANAATRECALFATFPDPHPTPAPDTQA
ncbi:FadR/GntR family transcriptional regulator [Actinocorallia sp. A-T 12471]|uniref:FadR/GntR family transcriptional regulator n=1 Tax=Actinocorallia sp. A-T 12471 TaxID=3089813 RepID=UPI0029D28AB9|nr:FadR/GntR family transcriptional regulator [Actinocorallia sp. A-T 12471]MDX6738261.1 FadR/GntR family transcriptional regulator [Actinocorallia sp. A-T 12471]